MPQVVLSVRQASVQFGKHTILDNIDLDIRAGEVTALLGPNGAGKSTLLKLMCGEINSDSPLTYFAQSSSQWPSQALARHLGILPQHSSLSFPFLAHEVVELGALPLNVGQAESRDIAIHYMQLTDVAHLGERLYTSLSGGEKQRLHLARVLTQLHQSGERKILMLDEPTSALDLAHQHNTLHIARELATTQQAAVIVVLHDLNLAAQYADRMVILHNGKLVEDAAPWEALQPKLLERVYGFSAMVAKHPTLDFPMVYPAA